MRCQEGFLAKQRLPQTGFVSPRFVQECIAQAELLHQLRSTRYHGAQLIGDPEADTLLLAYDLSELFHSFLYGGGECEHACPLQDHPAICITSLSESRSKSNQFALSRITRGQAQ
jgi:hypothetical protein